jgi:hypothetical protein
MLIKLTLEAIEENWENMKPAVGKALAPTVIGAEDQLAFTYSALMQDKMQAWAMLEGTEMVAVIITSFTGELGIEIRNLLIFALVSLKQSSIEQDSWVSSYEVLKSFAKKHKCHRIIAYTNEANVINIVTKLGGSAKNVLLTLEV